MREKRQALNAQEVFNLSARICAHIAALPQFQDAKNIMLYNAIHNEVDVSVLIAQAIEAGKRVFLPAMTCAAAFEAREYTPGCAQKSGAFGIMEPAGERIMPEELDFFVVPGLAFDKALHRIGFGAGCYDRFLAQTAAYTVGAAYAFQMVEGIKTCAHDVALNAVATENGIMTATGGIL